MGAGIVGNRKNLFNALQNFLHGISTGDNGVIQEVKSPTLTADGQVSISSADLGKMFTDGNVTAGKIVSIIIPADAAAHIGKEFTLVHTRAAIANHPRGVTAVGLSTTGKILSDTVTTEAGATGSNKAGKSFWTKEQGATITLGATADGWVVKNSYGNWYIETGGNEA